MLTGQTGRTSFATAKKSDIRERSHQSMQRPVSDYRRWEIPGIAAFTETPGGLVRIDLTTALAAAQVWLHGAHVTSFRPAGARPVLFLSRLSHFEKDKAIRGGVPVIFPWFGPRAGQPDSPAHGFARTMPWVVESLTCEDGGNVSLVLALESSEATRAQWPHEFILRHRISVGSELTMILEVTNRSAAPFSFEQALHTYLAVSDIREVIVTGFEGSEYLDKVDAARRKTQDHLPIRISGEADRVYLNTHATCTVEDPGMSRSISVEKSGSDSTILWNPWDSRAARLTDLGGEWPGMICIETANAAENAVTLAPGATHAMRATVRLR